ncbi:MAG: GntG family PLP-dependent aldolase [Deltaproteobacteria bacterium]|nr:GntG family PLP-dependent aldolase [Deltaproteobacteria bacterium]
MNTPTDLRSDTVTRPSAEMYDAMRTAPVGDDVFGEDPSVLSLQKVVAEMLGKEAALFVPSGTMANQLGLIVNAQRGDEVLVGEGAHCLWYETGGASILAQVQCQTIGEGGFFGASEITGAVHPPADWNPTVSTVCFENTHNRAGGRIWPAALRLQALRAALELGLHTHLDGARLWNAHIASGESLASICDGFDTVAVCFSKGLGAPVGSMLCGDRERIAVARRWRKRLGGGMRQAGVLAAAAQFALVHHLPQLSRDHELAERLSARLSGHGLRVAKPETNIVMIDLETTQFASELAVRLATQGVLVSAFGPHRLRAVTHRDVSEEQIASAADIIAAVVQS